MNKAKSRGERGGCMRAKGKMILFTATVRKKRPYLLIILSQKSEKRKKKIESAQNFINEVL